MLLAAGFGGRMVPITFFRAKPALPFLNRPLLLRQLDHLAAAGIDEVVINLHHRPASLLALLACAAGDEKASRYENTEEVNATTDAAAISGPTGAHRTDADLPGPFRIGSLLVHVCLETEILGTSGGLLGAAAHLAGDAPFLCLNSDCVCDVDLRTAVETHRRSGHDATMVVRPAASGDRFTPVWHDGRQVLGFGGATERLPAAPSVAAATAVFTGIHVLEPRVLDRLPRGRSEFLPSLYAPMIATGSGPGIYLTDAAWYEVGTPDRYIAAQVELLPAGKLGLHRPWRATQTRAQGPADGAASSLIGDCCRIHPAAALGAGTVLGNDVQVGAAAHIERSVVLDGAIIGDGARLNEVIVGPATSIPPHADLARTVVDRGVVPGDIPSRKRTARMWEGLWRADF